jgi:hypothetical protein
MSKTFTAKLRSILTFVAGGLLAICGYWNIVATYQLESGIPARDTNEIVVKERRFQPIRASLINAGYSGGLGFIREGDLQGRPWSLEDGKLWGQAQYVMLPWLLAHGSRATLFVIGDFNNAPGPELPGFSRYYDDGQGLVLYRARQLP